MRSRQFVFTWWAGLVVDSFGQVSIFRVARFGCLRIRRRPASASAVVVRRIRRSAAAAAVVPAPVVVESRGL